MARKSKPKPGLETLAANDVGMAGKLAAAALRYSAGMISVVGRDKQERPLWCIAVADGEHAELLHEATGQTNQPVRGAVEGGKGD